MLDIDARVAGTGHQVQRDGHDTDDQRAHKRKAKAAYLEMRPHQHTHQIKNQRIDDQREQAQREKHQRQRQDNQDGTHKRIEQPEHQRCEQQILPIFVRNMSVQYGHRHRYRKGIDDPSADELQDFFSVGLHAQTCATFP